MSLKILLIEDEPDLRELWCEYIGASGHDVRTAASLAQTREQLEQSLPQVVIADWNLPDATGDVVVRAVLEKVPDVTILITSGMGIDLPPDLQGKVHRVFRKPFSLRELRNALTALDS